ncbi:MAG: DUF2948 family protein [Pseudomonadota bacterium]
MTSPNPLRLMAQDASDLEIVSAAVQDAVSQAGNLSYKARQRRFTLELNRFRWEHEGAPKQRVRAILGIDNVLAARVRGLPQAQQDLVISVLQVRFEPGETAPEGQVIILLSGDGEIALDVEALDVTLLDSEMAWPTRKTPDHGQG